MATLELRYYPAGQVLKWWRSHTFGESPEQSAGFAAPNGYPTSTIKLDPVASGLHLDRRWSAWNHVEKFFRQNFEWHQCKGHMLKGDPSPVDDVWARWYEANPLMITAEIGASGTLHCPELVPHKLAEALEKWNAKASPHQVRSIRAAKLAAKEERLEAWQPNGTNYVTTVDEIRRWVERDLKKTHDSGNSAA